MAQNHRDPPVPPRGNQIHEPWLERWKIEFGVPPLRALDIGCGHGGDTRMLADWGHLVTAIDVSEEAVATSRKITPTATYHAMDIRDLPGPLKPGFGIIIASLSLHYFDRADTRRIFAAIRDLLAPRGVFAFRLNAEDDLGFGATGSHESWTCVEHKGVRKQFFTPAKIRSLLAGWAEIASLEKLATSRFGPMKSLYETIARASPE